MSRRRSWNLKALGLALLLPLAAGAADPVVYVSFSKGFDNKPCTAAEPCRHLKRALEAVNDGGEVVITESGVYTNTIGTLVGTLEIGKSVTIRAVPGATGVVVAKRGHGIRINAKGAKVALRNLSVVPLMDDAGLGSGISMSAGESLTIEDCHIGKWPGKAIVVEVPARVSITNSSIR